MAWRIEIDIFLINSFIFGGNGILTVVSKQLYENNDLKSGIVVFWENSLFPASLKFYPLTLSSQNNKKRSNVSHPTYCSTYLCILSLQPEEELDPEERDNFLQQLYKFMEDRGTFMLVH